MSEVNEPLFIEWEAERLLQPELDNFLRILLPRKITRIDIMHLFEEMVPGVIFAQKFLLGRPPTIDEFRAFAQRKFFDDEIKFVEDCLQALEDREKPNVDRLLDAIGEVQNYRWMAGGATDDTIDGAV
jgi:hypothetical protein